MNATASCCFRGDRCCCMVLEQACWVLKAQGDKEYFPGACGFSLWHIAYTANGTEAISLLLGYKCALGLLTV